MNQRGKNKSSPCALFSKSKKGQGLSINAIILIVLGVVVLALLIIGFAVGWKNVLPFLSTNNVDKIATSCNVACSTQSTFDFCSTKREVKTGEMNLKDVTCNYLAKQQPNLGISTCGTITCDQIFVNLGEEEVLSSKCLGNKGKTIQALIGEKLLSYTCPSA